MAEKPRFVGRGRLMEQYGITPAIVGGLRDMNLSDNAKPQKNGGNFEDSDVDIMARGDPDGMKEIQESASSNGKEFGGRSNFGGDRGRGNMRGNFSQRGGSRGGRGGGGESGGSRACYKCGAEGHSSRDCAEGVREQRCFKCNETGHSSRDCQQKDQDLSGQDGRANEGRNACFKCHQEGHMSRDCPSSRTGGGGGGRACHKCGEEGHMARECPKETSSSGRGCFKCGEEGHMSRDCPKQGSSSSRACHKCGEEGHMSRECPKQGSSSSRACHKCGEEGHMARECPKETSSSGRGCFKCGEEGHMSRECPKQGSSSSRACHKCGEEGHMSRECTKEGSTSNRACHKCGEEGHMSRECPKQGSSSGRACYKCGEEGHMSRECTKEGSTSNRACHKCGEEGHMSRECTKEGSTSNRACHKCGEEGHMSRECTKEGSTSNRGCFKCGEEGHMSRECTSEKSGGSACRKCGEEGHFARECPTIPPEERKPAPYIPPPSQDDEEHIFETLTKGVNFDKYDEIDVECTGKNAPKSGMKSFSDVKLSPVILENVRKTKYDKPTPVQKWAIPAILEGRDIMACAQTGSGKTAAFLIPILTKMLEGGIESTAEAEVQQPLALVLAPTRELVMQIYHETRKFSYDTMIRPVVVYGGVSVGYQRKELEKGCHIVIATPGRLLDFIRQKKLSMSSIKYFVLDEADRMLDLGFLQDIQCLSSKHDMPTEGRQTLMFSATFPVEIQRLAGDLLKDYIFLTIGLVGGANRDIQQIVYQVGRNEKRDKLLEILGETGDARTVVFVETKRNADFLSNAIQQLLKVPITSIHGDLVQKEREEALRDFRSGKAPIIIATSVAARGLDIPEVMHVINYDMPKEINEYVHRIGRTGRCGNLGKASSFFCEDFDANLVRPLIKVLMDAKQEIPDWLEGASLSTVGGGNFSSAGGRFGARDARRGGGRGGHGGGDSGSRPAPAPAAPADDDEGWE